jgi:hypothetical protein
MDGSATAPLQSGGRLPARVVEVVLVEVAVVVLDVVVGGRVVVVELVVDEVVVEVVVGLVVEVELDVELLADGQDGGRRVVGRGRARRGSGLERGVVEVVSRSVDSGGGQMAASGGTRRRRGSH